MEKNSLPKKKNQLIPIQIPQFVNLHQKLKVHFSCRETSFAKFDLTILHFGLIEVSDISIKISERQKGVMWNFQGSKPLFSRPNGTPIC